MSRYLKKSNKNFINLALPGDSAAGQIRKAFSYFENYGNPQIIVAMFPLYRMEMPTVPNKFFKKRLDVARYTDILIYTYALNRKGSFYASLLEKNRPQPDYA